MTSHQLSHQLLLVLTAVLSFTAAVPVGQEPADGLPAELPLAPVADQFDLDLAPLSSQHSQLMADTDVFGLYGTPVVDSDGGPFGAPVADGEGLLPGSPFRAPVADGEGLLPGSPFGAPVADGDGLLPSSPFGAPVADGEGLLPGSPFGAPVADGEGLLPGSPFGAPVADGEGLLPGSPFGAPVADGDGLLPGGLFAGPFAPFDPTPLTGEGGALSTADHQPAHVLWIDQTGQTGRDGAYRAIDAPADIRPDQDTREHLYATGARELTINRDRSAEDEAAETPEKPVAAETAKEEEMEDTEETEEAEETTETDEAEETAGVEETEEPEETQEAEEGEEAETAEEAEKVKEVEEVKVAADATRLAGSRQAHPGLAQPLMVADTPILCLLPDASGHPRSRTAPHGHGHDARRPQQHGAGESPGGDKPAAAGPQTPGAAAGGGGGRAQVAYPQPTASQRPLQFQGQPGRTAGGSPRPAAFQPPWSQVQPGEAAPLPSDGRRLRFEPLSGQPLYPGAESGVSSEASPDPAQFGQLPGQLTSARGGERGLLEQTRSPTFFAQYPRQAGYRSSPSPTVGAAGFHPAAGGGAGGYGWRQQAAPAWQYGGRPPVPAARQRAAHPAPWRGPGRPPVAAAGRWPWPALATESRGRPAAVPRSGVLLVSGGQFPLYSQWYRPAVVPLPGGGGSGPWRYVRPATAMATSEESATGADWPWPAVSMVGRGDALVVTGLGRNSGAMARAAGYNGWPPIAMATAGRSPAGGGFSRASSGGFNLIYQDGRFATGPMALRMSPEERVGPDGRPKVADTVPQVPDTVPETASAGEADSPAVEELPSPPPPPPPPPPAAGREDGQESAQDSGSSADPGADQ